MKVVFKCIVVTSHVKFTGGLNVEGEADSWDFGVGKLKLLSVYFLL